jgi:transcriptional regulator with XRE-family HTH domain
MRSAVEGFLMTYGADFREKRLLAEMTQLEVARHLGISQAIISHIETGRMLPPRRIRGAITHSILELQYQSDARGGE